MAVSTQSHLTFLEWLRAATESRWANTGSRDAATAGLGEPAWQPGTRWRGGMSESDLDIVEAMFGVHLPPAYREFLCTLHTPDPPLASLALRHGRLVRVEERLFPDWTGPTTPLLGAFEAPIEGLLRGVAIGRWHPAWGERPDDARERVRVVRALAAAGPRLIPFAGQRYLVAVPGQDDGPVIAVHGADMTVVAPDLASGLLRELGLGERRGPAPDSRRTRGFRLANRQRQSADVRRVSPDRATSAERELSPEPTLSPSPSSSVSGTEPANPSPADRIPFWSDVVDGVPWRPPGVTARA